MGELKCFSFTAREHNVSGTLSSTVQGKERLQPQTSPAGSAAARAVAPTSLVLIPSAHLTEHLSSDWEVVVKCFQMSQVKKGWVPGSVECFHFTSETRSTNLHVVCCLSALPAPLSPVRFGTSIWVFGWGALVPVPR